MDRSKLGRETPPKNSSFPTDLGMSPPAQKSILLHSTISLTEGQAGQPGTSFNSTQKCGNKSATFPVLTGSDHYCTHSTSCAQKLCSLFTDMVFQCLLTSHTQAEASYLTHRLSCCTPPCPWAPQQARLLPRVQTSWGF